MSRSFTLILTQGDVYRGKFKKGLMQGQGVYVHANGGIYDGEFLEGEKSGFGRMSFANGDEYEGALQWRNTVPMSYFC